MAKEFLFYGKTTDELKSMSLNDFMKLVPSKSRRSLRRGFTEEEKRLLELVDKKEKNIRTQCRDTVIIPSMIGLNISVYNGKTFFPITITTQMLGHRLGEFAHTRSKVSHSAPGIGATRSSAALSVR